MSQVQWAEDDFDLPQGAAPLGLSEPVDGKTYIMYHGTTKKNAQSIKANGFQQSTGGMLGRGVYLSRDLKKASRYPIGHPESDRAVVKVKVEVGKVIAINRQGHPLQRSWHDKGYDTAWVPPNCGMVKSGLEEDCVWDPKRIKVINIINPTPVRGRSADESPVDGQTYIMYHGTTKKNARSILASGFKQSADGMLGRGVYLSRDLKKASRYPINHPESDRAVVKVVVNVGRVKRIDRQHHPLQKTWHDHGYDTAWVPPNCGMVPSGLEEDCVWDPNQIKIIKVINPTLDPVIKHDTETIMSRFQWAEDDFDLPVGVFPLGLSAPVNGRKYVMYHGTTRSNAQSILDNGFCQSRGGMLGRGVYLSRDLQKASRYPLHHPESDRVVVKVVVNVGRVIAINYQGHPLQKSWHNHGYHTAWVPPNCGMVPSGLEEDCVWDPNRIQIINIIKPRPVQPEWGAWGYM
ncbi:grass carp reovirus (GCRV)-induced gene 2e [Lates calcarifer]|uniref:Grass carp reovirus (GCRV)-induced gene 2e n=1 Tax=Lates calcarifer TaxID=8187 RepID=A0AAJ7V8B1_LATCA|nr:grass carp reovirus (GCRV)-induced gene 2e [Lates calcarifer]